MVGPSDRILGKHLAGHLRIVVHFDDERKRIRLGEGESDEEIPAWESEELVLNVRIVTPATEPTDREDKRRRRERERGKGKEREGEGKRGREGESERRVGDLKTSD